MAASTKAARVAYLDTLDAASKQRYLDKIAIIGGQNPYLLKNDIFSSDPNSLPSISYPDIVNYLVYYPSPYTLEDLRCYKGLDAYNQFVSGWVREVRSTVINGIHLVAGRVLHSQRLRETPLRPWILAEKQGKVLSAHCDCMAGLGETCTHVSALLFHIETTARIRDSRTVTGEAAYWKIPATARDYGVSFLPIYQIDFTSAKTKKKVLDSSICDDNSYVAQTLRTPKRVPKPNQDNISQFLGKLAETGSKAAVLSIAPGHSAKFKPSALHGKFPVALTELYQADNVQLSYSDLLTKCQNVELSVTIEQSKCLEEATRAQAASKLWYRYRSGRITASKMKRVCRSNPDQPSQSLIRAICYPESQSFTSRATQWGCSHEEIARKTYMDKMMDIHMNFQVSSSGFVINPLYPFIGASPDGKVSCDCCGDGLIEIKCPYCARDLTISELSASGVRTCLTEENGQLSLNKDHEYMYQVQTQLHVCSVDYVDFVVWTNKDIHVERIEKEPEMWSEICEQSKHFFDKAVLPELLGKFYSKPLSAVSDASTTNGSDANNASDTNSDTLYCYCRQPEDVDDMIACDNENCSIVWFHLGCLRIKNVPKGKWFCPDCRKRKPSRKPKVNLFK